MNKANPLLTPHQPFISQGLRLGNRETSLDLLLSRNKKTKKQKTKNKKQKISRDSNYIGLGTIHRKGHEDDEAENAA